MKTKNAHGISIFEIQKNGIWKVVIDSKYNRRITPDRDMQIVGFARGSHFVKTSTDPDGIRSKGIWNNCGSGKTPCGTYLACEENFDKYFANTNKTIKLSEVYKRYGIGKKKTLNIAGINRMINLIFQKSQINQTELDILLK